MSYMPPPPPDDSDWSSGPPPPPGGDARSGPPAAGTTNLGTGETVRLASIGARIGARVLDAIIMIVGIIVLLVIGVASAMGLSGDDDDSTVAATLGLAVVALIVGVLYEVSMIALKGQTLGKMATSIKVVRADNGMIPGWGKSVGRWAVPALPNLIPGIGGLISLLVYVSLTFDKARRQGWHDKAASTLVIKASQ